MTVWYGLGDALSAMLEDAADEIAELLDEDEAAITEDE